MRKHFALKYLLLGGLIRATTVTALAADAEVQAKTEYVTRRSTARSRSLYVAGPYGYRHRRTKL